MEGGQDMRTTVMIKNIPNKMTDKQLLDFIERTVGQGKIDFLYLRIDFRTGAFAFVFFFLSFLF